MHFRSFGFHFIRFDKHKISSIRLRNATCTILLEDLPISIGDYKIESLASFVCIIIKIRKMWPLDFGYYLTSR